MLELNPTEPPFVAPKRWEALVPIAGAILVEQIFDRIAEPDRGTVAAAAALALAACLRMSWPLRKYPWFWITWFLLVIVHVNATLMFSWSGAAAWNGLTFMPFAAADVLFVMTVVYLGYRIARGKPDQLFADDAEVRKRYADTDH